MNFGNVKEINLMLGGLKPKNIVSGFWCGVDEGARYLLKNNIVPLIVYGDLDSINLKLNEKIIIRKKESQDLTDSDFAIQSVLKDFPNIGIINLYGATGKRLDHFFGNIMLLNNEKVKVNIIDDNNLIFISKIQENILEYKKEYKYISFVPIFENTIITINNAKYNVENYKLTLEKPNATSNEFCSEENIILITNKKCLVIYSKD